MPFTTLVKTITNGLHSGLPAELVALDEETGCLVCEMESDIEPGAEVRLRFRGGPSLLARAGWQRAGNGSDNLRFTSFTTRDTDWDQLKTNLSPKRPLLRQSRRVSMRLWVDYADRPGGSVTLDLSPEGCRIAADLRKNVGDTIPFYLDLPDQTGPLRFDGQVRWSNGRESGLRFINLCASQEIRLLHCLGRATVPPSTFRPDNLWLVPPHRYELTTRDEKAVLRLSVTNWDFAFTLKDVRWEGADKGAFHSCEVLTTSPRLLQLKAELKVNLDTEISLVHLKLYDGEGAVLTEVLGQELEFERIPRSGPQGSRKE